MEIFETAKEFIKPELLVLIPVLYLIGIGLKKSEVKDKTIPLFLGLVSILLSSLYIFATSDIKNIQDASLSIFTSLTQGILIAGCSVYINQIYKQSNKKK